MAEVEGPAAEGPGMGNDAGFTTLLLTAEATGALTPLELGPAVAELALAAAAAAAFALCLANIS